MSDQEKAKEAIAGALSSFITAEVPEDILVRLQLVHAQLCATQYPCPAVFGDFVVSKPLSRLTVLNGRGRESAVYTNMAVALTVVIVGAKQDGKLVPIPPSVTGMVLSIGAQSKSFVINLPTINPEWDKELYQTVVAAVCQLIEDTNQ